MIDAHCHLQDGAFKKDFADLIEETRRAGVTTVVVNGTRESDWSRVASLAEEYPDFILPSFGLHPWFVEERSPDWLKALEQYLDQFPGAGIGEIGLDRWIRNYDLDLQTDVFEQQWHLAHEKNRPVTVHCLQAWGHLEAVLHQWPANRFLLHSYSGSREMISIFEGLGARFSLSGYFLRNNKRSKKEVFENVPENRLLLETDAPEMRPPVELDRFPDRSYNHPANLTVIYDAIGREKEKQIENNFDSWFHGTGFS